MVRATARRPGGEAAAQEMASVQLGRQPGALQHGPQLWNDTVRVQPLLAQMAPAIDGAEHRSADDAGDANPVAIGRYRTQPRQGGCLVSLALVVAIALAPGQKQLHALPRQYLDVLHLQSAQLVTAKGAPESGWKCLQRWLLEPRRMPGRERNNFVRVTIVIGTSRNLSPLARFSAG